MRKSAKARSAKPAPAIDPADIYVGVRIRARRKELDMTQQELGTASGITFQQIQKYENGKNRVSASRLIQFAHSLKTVPAYFFEGAPGVKNHVAENVGIYEIVMRSSDGVELVRSFSRIQNRGVRHSLMELTRSLAAAAT
jgi:transcriptional regulator with XRE-family HTH domain